MEVGNLDVMEVTAVYDVIYDTLYTLLFCVCLRGARGLHCLDRSQRSSDAEALWHRSDSGAAPLTHTEIRGNR
jgi:hypothetical protein